MKRKIAVMGLVRAAIQTSLAILRQSSITAIQKPGHRTSRNWIRIWAGQSFGNSSNWLDYRSHPGTFRTVRGLV